MTKVHYIRINVEESNESNETSEAYFVIPSSIDTSEMCLDIRRMIEKKYFPEICPDAEEEILDEQKKSIQYGILDLEALENEKFWTEGDKNTNALEPYFRKDYMTKSKGHISRVRITGSSGDNFIVETHYADTDGTDWTFIPKRFIELEI